MMGRGIQKEKKNTEPKKEVLYSFMRKHGKHYLRTPQGVVIVRPGDILTAPAGSYVGNQWECLGPVEAALEEDVDKSTGSGFAGFVKEQHKDGFFVINPVTGEALNTEPLTEEEADAIVAVSAENP